MRITKIRPKSHESKKKAKNDPSIPATTDGKAPQKTGVSNASLSSHSPDCCDRCGKKVGKANLHPFPFLYMDKSDKHHPDAGLAAGLKERGYRRHYGCAECVGAEEAIARQRKERELLRIYEKLYGGKK
jgi:hypothetical protein